MGSRIRLGACTITAVLASVPAVVPSGSARAAAPLDARALVAQPREVGGIRSVTGAWTSLGDDGNYPLADAIGGGGRVPENIAYLVTYGGLVGTDLTTQISSIAVVLPSARAARRLLARTDAVEGFIGGKASPTSPTRALNGADAMRSGQRGGSATIAWTHGRLYGLINASGPAAGRAAQLAVSEARRFARALAGGRVSADPQLTATPSYPPPTLPVPTPVSPAPPAHVIDRAGRYTLADLGVTLAQAFDPVSGEQGISVPVTFDLPDTPTGRWLWRATVHVLVTLAPTASPGIVGVDPLVANVSGPGADFDIARNLTTGRPVMVEMTRHVATTRTFEVTASAMLGGSPSPRQDTTIRVHRALVRPAARVLACHRLARQRDRGVRRPGEDRAVRGPACTRHRAALTIHAAPAAQRPRYAFRSPSSSSSSDALPSSTRRPVEST